MGWFNHQIGEDFFNKICLDYASCNKAVAKIYGKSTNPPNVGPQK